MNKGILNIDDIKTAVANAAEDYGVAKVFLFGSYARGSATINSDVDLRIDKGRLRGLFQLSGFQINLEERLNVGVDVLTTESLDERFLRNIQHEEIVLYERNRA